MPPPPASSRYRSRPVTQTPSPAATPSSARHVYVIHWENVLVPTTWLTQNLGINTTVQSLEPASRRYANMPAPIYSAMRAIEERALQLLSTAMQKGPIVILSSNTVLYVELLCSLLFPRLTAWLRSATSGVCVMGIPQTPRSPLQCACFEQIFANNSVIQSLQQPGSGSVAWVSMHAQAVDLLAKQHIQRIAPYMVVKSVQAKMPTQNGGHSLESFYAQLALLTQFTIEATAFNGPIQVQL